VAYQLKPIAFIALVFVAVLVQYSYYSRTTPPASTMSEMKSVAYFVNWVCAYV
jgi:hypothetical protein